MANCIIRYHPATIYMNTRGHKYYDLFQQVFHLKCSYGEIRERKKQYKFSVEDFGIKLDKTQ